MEGFDTMTMSYLAAPPMSLSNVTAADAMGMPMLPMESGLEHRSNYDTETFAG
jgi:hypothetical protein